MTRLTLHQSTIFVLAVCWFLVSNLSGQEQESLAVRKWTSGSHEVIGQLISRTSTHVNLRTEKHDSVKVKVDVLSDKDRKFLAGLEIVEANIGQIKLVQPRIDDFEDDVETTLEILHEVSRNQETSPYAALYAGVLYATEKGNFRQAKRLFEAADKRIAEQQELMGPDFHAKTRKALLNNIAVCSFYMGQGAQVTRFLQKGFEAEPTFVIYHNAYLYLNSKNKFRKGSELSRNTRKKLVRLIAVQPPQGLPFELPERFMLSTFCDSPMTPLGWSNKFDQMHGDPIEGPKEEKLPEEDLDAIEDDRGFGMRRVGFRTSEEQLQEFNLFPVLWCAKCDGDGIRACPNKQCSKGRVLERTKVKVGTFPFSGAPKYQWSTNSHRCDSCRGKGNLKCSSCSTGKLSLHGALE